MLLRSWDQRHREKRILNLLPNRTAASQKSVSPQRILHIFNALEPTYSSSLCSLVSNKAQKYTLPGAQQDVMIGWEICRRHKRSSQILQLAVRFSWEIKIPAEKKEMEQMQHLHGASSHSRFPVPVLCFLILWSATAVPVTKKARGAPQCAGEGARGGQQKDGYNPRRFRDIESSLEDTGLPHFGARSHLLFNAETPSFLVQDDIQALSGEAEGMFHAGWDTLAV